MRAVVLCAAMGACGGPAPTHTLYVRDVPVATATHSVAGQTTTWRFDYAFEGPATRREERVTVDAHGALSDFRAETWVDGTSVRTVTLQVDASGAAQWSTTMEDDVLHGTWALPTRPLSPLVDTAWSPGDAWVWDGERVVVATAAAQRLTSETGSWAWSEGVLTLPDGSRLVPGTSALPPVDPVGLLSVPSEPIANARTSRSVQLVWPHRSEPIVQERPLAAEVPADPAEPWNAAPVSWALPEPLPATQRVLAALSTRGKIDEAFDLTRAKVQGRSAEQADCQPLSRHMTSLLVGAGVRAEVVRGWLYVDGLSPRFVRHAWVRVYVGGDLGWLHTDPALGQRIADPTHLPDALVGAAAVDGTVAVQHVVGGAP